MQKLMEKTEKLKKKLFGMKTLKKEDNLVSDVKSTNKCSNTTQEDRLYKADNKDVKELGGQPSSLATQNLLPLGSVAQKKHSTESKSLVNQSESVEEHKRRQANLQPNAASLL